MCAGNGTIGQVVRHGRYAEQEQHRQDNAKGRKQLRRIITCRETAVVPGNRVPTPLVQGAKMQGDKDEYGNPTDPLQEKARRAAAVAATGVIAHPLLCQQVQTTANLYHQRQEDKKQRYIRQFGNNIMYDTRSADEIGRVQCCGVNNQMYDQKQPEYQRTGGMNAPGQPQRFTVTGLWVFGCRGVVSAAAAGTRIGSRMVSTAMALVV